MRAALCLAQMIMACRYYARTISRRQCCCSTVWEQDEFFEKDIKDKEEGDGVDDEDRVLSTLLHAKPPMHRTPRAALRKDCWSTGTFC